MRKIIATVLIILTLSACSRIASVPKTDVPDSTTAGGTILVFTAYRNGNTVIYYPQIEGMTDASRQDKLNEEILNDAKNVITLFSDDVQFITVDYEIVARSDEKIVIEYTGHGCKVPSCDDEQTVTHSCEIYL
ncbi:MAG: hypothetical protein IKY44_05135 [Clostridia bacterium]|nr:hypothetical protein [Clostridia bacterium]